MPDLAVSQHYVECQSCGGYAEFYCNACHQLMCGECRNKHLKHSENTQHEICRYEDRKLTILSVPCRLHPRQQLNLCCENCHQAICALCTTKGQAGHGFLDFEEVYTKNYKTRIEQIRKIRDLLPTSRLRLKESRNATLEVKENLEMLKSSMKEQASQIKGLVDIILSENLQYLHSYETSAVEKLENQETALFTYVTQMQALLEEYENSTPSVDFLSDLNHTLNVKLEPIPEVPKISPGNFSNGKLSKEEIRKQFGVLTKPTN